MTSTAHMLGHGNCPACNEEELRQFEAMQRLRAVNEKLLETLEHAQEWINERMVGVADEAFHLHREISAAIKEAKP